MKFLALLLTCIFTVFGAQQVQAKASCDQIDAAISATEDFAEKIPAGDISAVKPDMLAIRENLAAVASALSPEAASAAEADVKAMDEAIARADYPASASAALGLYRTLATAFAKRLPTTFDVAMQDYAGFELRVLASQPEADWAAIDVTMAESAVNWAATRKNLKDKALTDLGNTIQAGLADAARAKNTAWLSSIAQIQLDTVDLLEHVVKNPSKEACK
jgi:hypothetical protein